MSNSAPIHLVFMLEEESAKSFLQGLLPKILPSCVIPLYISHEGRQDLQKSIPIKLRAWRAPNTFFIILHDQDNHDCKALKGHLRQLCVSSYHNPLIRIVCRELEAWYCGDLEAVKKVFPKFNADNYKEKHRFQTPDSIEKPANVLKQIDHNFNKRRAAREIPKHMDVYNNKSCSFNHMIAGVKKLVATQLHAQKTKS